MSFMDAMEIAASGLSASRKRMNLTASNLANAKTTQSKDGGPYRRKSAVLTAAPLRRQPFSQMLGRRMSEALRGVRVTDVVEDTRPPREQYDPGHPDADKNGIVRLPNVNMVEEMVDMMTAARSYEAGLSTLQTIKAMATRALQIGK